MSDETPRGRALGRRRRANVTGGRQHSHRVLVTPEEEALLLQRAEAARVTVPRLLIESALAERGETATDRREALEDLFRVRGYLGAVSNNVNQIARAMNATGELHEDLVRTLEAVRATSARVNRVLDALAVGS